MSLSGLTLEVRGGGNHNEERSVAMLEIQSSSPGILGWLKEWMSDGTPVIFATKWTEDSVILFALPNNEDLDSQRTSWFANNAEYLGRLGVTAQDLGL
jgi:hypothetical protein